MKHTLSILLVTLAAFSTACAAKTEAAECKLEITASDKMKFNTAALSVPSACKEVTLTLKNEGKLPKNIMGHNWVLSAAADAKEVATAGASAGLDKEYVPQGDKRVLASTKVVGPGESTSVTFDVSKLKAGEKYAYFCSFPGHSMVMKGIFTIK